METKKQKRLKNFILVFGLIYGFFIIAAMSVCGIILHLSEKEVFWFVCIPLTIILCVVTVWMTLKLQQYQFHENGQFSRIIYQMKRIEGGKVVSPEKMAELKRQLIAVVEADPALEIEANRYLGDLAFATMETDEALRYYAEALNHVSPNTDEYFYLLNRSTAGLLRVGNYQVALKEFKYLAEIKPYYSIGLAAMYEFGWGVEPNLEEASRLYKQAMLEGNDLAVMNYYEVQWRISNSVPDTDNDGYAEYMLKCHDQEGYKAGVPALTESAEAGYAPSQFELGTLYMQGNLGRNKQAEAFHWLRLGADQNYLPALHNLGFLVQMKCMDPIKGDINKPKIPGTFLYDDKVRWSSFESGMVLIRQAAEAGYPPSQHSLGATYLREGQNDKAKIWLKRAANQGYKKAIDDYEHAFGLLS